MSTAATTTWTGAANKTEADAPTFSELVITLLDDSTITIPLNGWDPENAIQGIFRENFFRDRKNGVYYAASQIKSIKPVREAENGNG